MATAATIEKFHPTDPSAGDFHFQGVEPTDFNPDDWPANPGAYRPTLHFREYYRKYDRFLTGEIINEAITGGKLIPSFDETGAFYTTRPGVVYYIVVGWDRSSSQESNDRVVVTGWPHVFDREAAIVEGRFNTRALNEVQKINGTLFNTRTADDGWLEYYEKCVSP